MRTTMVNKVLEFKKKNDNVMFVTGDLGYGALEPIQDMFKEDFINCGIAEQNMISFSSGLALNNKKVFCYSISTFPTLRCLEQIRNDVCYHNADVTIINIGTGLEYGSLGITHHSTEDIGCMRTMPNMKVYVPSCAKETEMVLDEIYKIGGPSFVRLNKAGADFNGPTNTTINEVENHNSNICAIASGTILQEAINYNKTNEKIDIYSLVCYFRDEKVAEVLRKYDYVISMEEHQVNCGLYSYLCEVKNKYNLTCKIIPLALKGQFASKVGKQSELRAHYGLDANALKTEVLNIRKK